MTTETTDYAGFIVSFEPSRSKKILSWLEDGGGFSDSFSLTDWDLKRKEIAFLTLEKRGKEIDAVALVQRAHGAGGTGKPKYGFDNSILIKPPITASELEPVFQQLADHISRPTRGRRIDPFLWKRFIEKVKQLRPHIAAQLDDLLLLVHKNADLLGGTGRQDRLAEQRDGLGTALDIASIRRPDVLKKLNASKSSGANSILDLFDDLAIHERHLIEKDKVILEKIFSSASYKGAVFQSKGINEVRIYVSDKTDLETALGTDLIIYQSLWNSMILVQYKVMRQYGEDCNSWHYRPDSTFYSQVNQIDSVMQDYPAYEPADPWSFRLNDEPNYFKFCERRKPSSRDDSLVRGMSMDRKTMLHFLNMKEADGKKGGKVIGYDNCPRYLNNTEFSMLAKMGWIGSSGSGTKYLENTIRRIREYGRAPIVAIVDVPRLNTVALRKASKAAASGRSSK